MSRISIINGDSVSPKSYLIYLKVRNYYECAFPIVDDDSVIALIKWLALINSVYFKLMCNNKCMSWLMGPAIIIAIIIIVNYGVNMY